MTSPSQTYDVAVVGAGPAGLSAATTAADAGARVVLLDSGHALGGQYWRHPGDVGLALAVAKHHHDLSTYRQLVDAIDRHVRAGRVVVHLRHSVWATSDIGHGFAARAVDEQSVPRRERLVMAKSLVLAPGAYDRQLPFPGWDLPGVMTAGGVQALLKGNDVVAGRRILVAGTGPFLLSVGSGLAKAGATVVGVHEASTPRRWLPHLGVVAQNAARVRDGAGFVATLARRRIRYAQGSTVIAARGDDRLESVTVARVDADGRVVPGSERDHSVDTLAVGWGFTPQVELPLSLGCASRIDTDGSVVIDVDADQRSSVDGVYIAGEACGVGGAELAVVEGCIAGAAAASPRARPGTSELRAWDRRRRRLRSFAKAMHEAYPVTGGWIDRVTPETIICRCEEVSNAQLRRVAEDDATSAPRSAKLLARVGMGWCQGRICGYAAACMVARYGGSEFAPGQLAERPVASPITLDLLAAEPVVDLPSTGDAA
jgi:thioredoxin reductase